MTENIFVKKIKLILEGSNLVGKSQIFSALEKKYVHSVALTIHGYCRPEIQKEIKNNNNLVKYFKNRLLSLVSIFKNFQYEEVLFNRLHLTDIVYCRLFLNVEQNYKQLEKNLNEISVGLVLLDCNNKVLQKRYEERKKTNKPEPWGKGFISVIEKRDMFRQAFKESQIKKKIIIDTSTTTAEEAAEKIIEWWKRT